MITEGALDVKLTIRRRATLRTRLIKGPPVPSAARSSDDTSNNKTMRLSAYAFLGYCLLRGVALYAKPERIFAMFPGVTFEGKVTRYDNPAQTAQVALSSALALADLMLACGALSLGGIKGRFESLAIIFPMFYYNHIVIGVAHPPIVPVVAVNVAVLVLNLVEAMVGGSAGKYSYALMQGGFGLLFLTEAPDLVQDPFTFATEGTNALLVGQKLGFAIGMILTMHCSMTLLKPPMGCILALCIALAGMAKMAYVDAIPLGPAPPAAAGICMALCLVDVLMNGGAGKKGKAA